MLFCTQILYSHPTMAIKETKETELEEARSIFVGILGMTEQIQRFLLTF